MNLKSETATLGGGCFWCLEAVYEQIEGVLNVISGYAGGNVANPDYQTVCTGTSGHAEVVQITFNPQVIRFRDLLEIFFSIHNPTTLNRQGADIGPQYRSVIFCHNENQCETARQMIADLDAANAFSRPIVTEVALLDVFYPAEDYHQEYFRRNPNQGYCRAVIAPKVAKFQRLFSFRLKSG